MTMVPFACHKLMQDYDQMNGCDCLHNGEGKSTFCPNQLRQVMIFETVFCTVHLRAIE